MRSLKRGMIKFAFMAMLACALSSVVGCDLRGSEPIDCSGNSAVLWGLGLGSAKNQQDKDDAATVALLSYFACKNNFKSQ